MIRTILKAFVLIAFCVQPAFAQAYSYGVVSDPDGWTNLRSKASLKSPVIDRVNSGDRVIVTQAAGNFLDCLLLVLNDDTPEIFGFIHKSRVKDVKAALGAGIVNDPDGWSNLRVRPSTSSEVVQQIRPSDGFFVVVEKAPNPNQDWYLIETRKGSRGYLHGSRLEWVIPRN